MLLIRSWHFSFFPMTSPTFVDHLKISLAPIFQNGRDWLAIETIACLINTLINDSEAIILLHSVLYSDSVLQ